jgi:hypothetical protein
MRPVRLFTVMLEYIALAPSKALAMLVDSENVEEESLPNVFWNVVKKFVENA